LVKGSALSKNKSKKKLPIPVQTPVQNSAITNQEHPQKKLQLFKYYAIIFIVTTLAFLPSLNNGFINWDDGDYVTKNPDIMGFSIHNIAQIFSSTYVANYQPFTMLSYMLDYQFFNLNPTVFHATNLLWHIAASLLVFLVIFNLSGSKFTGLLTALLFAIHPLRVESVAWVAERKDVMSAFFFFLSLLLYIQHLKFSKRIFYNLSAMSFIISLLCKPMAVSLPIILLLIHYFRNINIDKKVILKTIPFFIITILFSLITLFAQNVLSPIGTDTFSVSIINRLCIPFYGLLFYFIKTIIPLHLCSFYPFPEVAETPIIVTIAPFFFAGILTVVFLFRKKISKLLIFGMLFYFFTLLPVLQIIPVGNAMVAERYSYIPCIGLFFPFAAFIHFLLKEKYKNQKNIQYVITTGISILIITFSCISFSRCSVWKDSIALWNDVVNKYPVDDAYYFRGLAYSEKGNYPNALLDFNQAIKKNPQYALAFDARGTVYFSNGQYDNALEDYSEAIRIVPKNAISYANRGSVYSQKGDFENAIRDFSEAINIHPKSAFASYCNRGMAYGHVGKFDLAVSDFSKAIKLNPRYMQVYYYRGVAYSALGENSLAMSDLNTSCKLGFDMACKALSGQ
jgi:tetratricopeptide (TPR) repeat protein